MCWADEPTSGSRTVCVARPCVSNHSGGHTNTKVQSFTKEKNILKDIKWLQTAHPA